MTPSKKERLFDKSYAKELLNIAKGDYKTALAMEKIVEDIRIENIFYLAQQSIEKILKAVLVSQNIAVPLVHDLGILVAKIPKEIEPPYGYELSELNQYASIRKYEEGVFIPSKEELRLVMEKSEEMLTWASKIIPQG